MSVQKFLDKIKNGRYGVDITDAIIGGIKKCYDDASVNHDNANMEVKMARGSHNTLNDRLDNVDEIQAQTNAQLSEADLKLEQQKKELNYKTPHFERIKLEDKEAIHSTGYPYTSFFSGVYFAGKEVYAGRTSYNHYSQKDKKGKIVFYIRKESGDFYNYIPDLSYDAIGGECRDANLSISNDGNYLFFSTFVNDGNGKEGGYMWIFDKNLNIISNPILILPFTTGEGVVWGNILQTPSGHLIKTAYKRNPPYSVDIYRSLKPLTTDFSDISFEKVNSISSTDFINETNICYWNDRLVFIIRNENGGSYYADSYDLEGNGYICPLKKLPYAIHSPNVNQFNRGDYLVIGGSLKKTSTLRQPCIGYLNDTLSKCYFEVIDNEITQFSGYPSLVKNAYGYGMMYYENNNDVSTNVYFKDVILEKYLPNIKRYLFKSRVPFDSYSSNFVVDGYNLSGILVNPQNIFKKDAFALDIVVRPYKNVTITGVSTMIKSNVNEVTNCGFQILNPEGTVLQEGDRMTTNILNSDSPKMKLFRCPPYELQKGQSYIFRIWGNLTVYYAEIEEFQRYFEIAKTGILYESTLKNLNSVSGVSFKSVVPLGILLH